MYVGMLHLISYIIYVYMYWSHQLWTWRLRDMHRTVPKCKEVAMQIFNAKQKLKTMNWFEARLALIERLLNCSMSCCFWGDFGTRYNCCPPVVTMVVYDRPIGLAR